MPESVRDRCSRTYEHILLLAKSKNYYYNAAAIAEPIDDTASGGSSSEGGKRTEWYVTPEIPYFNISTEIDSETDPSGYARQRYYYGIDYYWQITYEADTSLEGLHYLIIELLNVDKLIIGDKTSITNRNPYGYFED